MNQRRDTSIIAVLLFLVVFQFVMSFISTQGRKNIIAAQKDIIFTWEKSCNLLKEDNQRLLEEIALKRRLIADLKQIKGLASPTINKHTHSYNINPSTNSNYIRMTHYIFDEDKEILHHWEEIKK